MCARHTRWGFLRYTRTLRYLRRSGKRWDEQAADLVMAYLMTTARTIDNGVLVSHLESTGHRDGPGAWNIVGEVSVSPRADES